jgi:hypothetical protein
MKCIKALKASKDVEVGDIKRVDDRTANNMVGSMWAYIPKSEWKLTTRKSKPKTEQVSEQETEQVEKKPYKKGQKSEKHKNKQ